MNRRQRRWPEFGEHLEMINDLTQGPVAGFVAGVRVELHQALEDFLGGEFVCDGRRGVAGDGADFTLPLLRLGEGLLQVVDLALQIGFRRGLLAGCLGMLLGEDVIAGTETDGDRDQNCNDRLHMDFISSHRRRSFRAIGAMEV